MYELLDTDILLKYNYFTDGHDIKYRVVSNSVVSPYVIINLFCRNIVLPIVNKLICSSIDFWCIYLERFISHNDLVKGDSV